MIGHLGPRVSALLDGQLSPAETERAWAHVHGCHACRDAVEREGWVKTRLAGLAAAEAGAPDRLKGSLRGGTPMPPGRLDTGPQRRVGLVVLGGSAVGAAVLGLLAFGLGPGDVPDPGRRPPVSDVGGSGSDRPSPSPLLPSPSR